MANTATPTEDELLALQLQYDEEVAHASFPPARRSSSWSAACDGGTSPSGEGIPFGSYCSDACIFQDFGGSSYPGVRVHAAENEDDGAADRGAALVGSEADFPTIAAAEELLLSRSLEEKAVLASSAPKTPSSLAPGAASKQHKAGSYSYSITSSKYNHAAASASSGGQGKAKKPKAHGSGKSKGKAPRAAYEPTYDDYEDLCEDELHENCQFAFEEELDDGRWPQHEDLQAATRPAQEDDGADQQQQQEPLRPEDSSSSYLTCAICLDEVAPEELALVKGCEHAYCCACILRWADTQVNGSKSGCGVATCPTCKAPFEYVYIARNLDGTLNDSLAEESITLLLRATWLDKQREEQINSIGTNHAGYYEDFCDDDYCDEDDDDLLLLNRHTRGKLLGNRRFGSGGYVQSGRLQARAPSASPSTSSGSSGNRGKGSKEGKGKLPMSPVDASAPAATPPSASSGKKGRRARRKEKEKEMACAAH
mmetsp:Transcript_10186/g.37444  ORF Transcript_10186/g.37444 Transcript_10186/m.37444 type:complete len:482 (-) Transcript_10186:203-1648(-)